jgi:hypothetical protein
MLSRPRRGCCVFWDDGIKRSEEKTRKKRGHQANQSHASQRPSEPGKLAGIRDRLGLMESGQSGFLGPSTAHTVVGAPNGIIMRRTQTLHTIGGVDVETFATDGHGWGCTVSTVFVK